MEQLRADVLPELPELRRQSARAFGVTHLGGWTPRLVLSFMTMIMFVEATMLGYNVALTSLPGASRVSSRLIRQAGS